MKPFLLSIGLLFVLAAGFTACGEKSASSHQPQQGKSPAAPVTDFAGLIANLRAAGARVEPKGEVDQPFFAVAGRLVKVHGEEVQVFQYPHAAAADAQAALVSPDGSAVGTSKPLWLGPPHFFKQGKLLVLYIGDNDKVLQALETVLGQPFAGRHQGSMHGANGNRGSDQGTQR